MSEPSNRTRVLIIEHNRLLLEGLARLLSELPDTELAGVATSGSAGLTLFEQLRPVMTVLELELPATDAAELVRQFRRIDARSPIVVLATYELDQAGARVIAAGATAVVAKDQIATKLVALIRGLVSA